MHFYFFFILLTNSLTYLFINSIYKEMLWSVDWKFLQKQTQKIAQIFSEDIPYYDLRKKNNREEEKTKPQSGDLFSAIKNFSEKLNFAYAPRDHPSPQMKFIVSLPKKSVDRIDQPT